MDLITVKILVVFRIEQRLTINKNFKATQQNHTRKPLAQINNVFTKDI